MDMMKVRDPRHRCSRRARLRRLEMRAALGVRHSYQHCDDGGQSGERKQRSQLHRSGLRGLSSHEGLLLIGLELRLATTNSLLAQDSIMKRMLSLAGGTA